MAKSAIICPIKDENTYIYKFFEYYHKHFDKEDIYILDFGSKQSYLEEVLYGNANIIKTSADITDADSLFIEIKKNIKKLKISKNYDYVIPLDVDEILYYHEEGGLKEFLKKSNYDIITCYGFEVIHIPGLQNRLDINKPWFSQLKYWYENNAWYGKTLITKHDLEWNPGFHAYRVNGIISDNPHRHDKLFLIHLHRHDFILTVNRHIDWANMEWSKKTIDKNYCYHYRNKNTEEIIEWYFDPILSKKINKIPEEIKININI